MSDFDIQPSLAERAKGSDGNFFEASIRNGRPGIVGRLSRNPSAIIGIAILVLIILSAVFASVIRPGDPLSVVGPSLLWPGEDTKFPLGTDVLGRDVLAGVLHGARVSLFVGLAATFIGLTVGSVIGATAGYFGGWIDDLIVRFTEIFQVVPSFVMLVVLVAIAQPSVTTVVGGIALVSWDAVARLVRAEFRSIRQKDFVTAATAIGYTHQKIIIREILPNALPPLVVTSSIMVASAILMESALSFMGLGDPNTVSWGSMIGTGRDMLRTHWYLSAIPGAFIVLSVLSLNLIGDGLNDALNPRQRPDRSGE